MLFERNFIKGKNKIQVVLNLNKMLKFGYKTSGN